MANLSDKVLNSVKYANQFKQEFQFGVNNGSTVYITFNNQNLLEVDTLAEANSFATILNNSLSNGISKIREHDDNKIKAILNA